MLRPLLFAAEDPLQAAATQPEQQDDLARLPPELARRPAVPATAPPPRTTPTARLTHATSLRAHLIVRAILRRRRPFFSLQTVLRTRAARHPRGILKTTALRRGNHHPSCL